MEKKKKPIIVRILLILILIILSPFIIIDKVIKLIIKRKKYKEFDREVYGQRQFLENNSIEKIDIMEGYEFEAFLKVMFFYLGYRVSAIGGRSDYGADLLLYKDNQTTAVQIKRYTKNVGAHSVQEVIGASNHYKANYMVVITNSHFTSEAEQIARENQVELIDREHLIELVNKVTREITSSTNGSEIVEYTDRYKYRI